MPLVRLNRRVGRPAEENRRLLWILPVIGRVSFGERWPKDYLEKTIEKFHDARNIGQQMRWAGFEKIGFYPLSRGIAGLFVGYRC